MAAKRLIESQPTRKKIWWLLLLVPIIYVVVDNLIYPIDEKALMKRTVYEEMEAREPTEADEEEDFAPTEEYEPENGDEELTGWDIYDRVWIRVEKAWPLIASILAFAFRRKLVGDPR
jgi:hypothetical protein